MTRRSGWRFYQRRRALGLSHHRLSLLTGVDIADIKALETYGKADDIRWDIIEECLTRLEDEALRRAGEVLSR